MKTILRYVSPAAHSVSQPHSQSACSICIHKHYTYEDMYTFLTILRGHTFAESDVATEDQYECCMRMLKCMLQGATCENIIHFSRFVEDKVFTVEKHTSVDETVQKDYFFLKFSRQEEHIPRFPITRSLSIQQLVKTIVIHFLDMPLKCKFILTIRVLMDRIPNQVIKIVPCRTKLMMSYELQKAS